MVVRELDCLADPEAPAARPVWAVRSDDLAGFLADRPAAEAAFLRDSGFTAAEGELILLPGPSGVAGAVLGLGARPGMWSFGDLPRKLPAGTIWRLEPGDYARDDAILGFCLGAYRFTEYKPARRAPVLLAAAPTPELAETARAIWLARDLINLPAADLGPNDLAAAVRAVGERYGARVTITDGAELARTHPAVAAVGAGSARPPCVARLEWNGAHGGKDAPLIALCGKGVCFDSGGYDIKPASGMLRMKKDMGGAAMLLGLAALIMATRLPVRLLLLVGCVENSVSGTAMRPLDVLRTRSGRTVEVGNTDAEGRLVLCDLLDEACAAAPVLLLDAATLTGAARAALGPDLPALFCNDEGWAAALQQAGTRVDDPVWRLPLWPGYESWLDSPVADMGNVSAKPFAGAIVAALFLQRFVTPGTVWAHVDTYAWNDTARPGRPEGGEAQALRALYNAVSARFAGASVTKCYQ